MKLTFDQIRTVVTGAVRFREEDGLLRLFRFTEEQEELYRVTNADFYTKTFASSGMRFQFRTDSRTLSLRAVPGKGSSRSFFSFDVFVDGEMVGYVDNYSHAPLPEDYIPTPFSMEEISGTVSLGDGIKTVTVYLPWSVSIAVRELSLDDGAFVEPVKAAKKLLVFGDSITQGYDALRPSERYISRLADALGAEEINKAIGGEQFFPALAKLPESFTPDYVVVAYGTNDWSHAESSEAFCRACRDFYETVSRRYPAARIFAITPIWRKDMNEYRPFGAFANAENYIREAVSDLENVTVIRGFDFVPKDTAYFSDGFLHPNDEGFRHYARNLIPEVLKQL